VERLLKCVDPTELKTCRLVCKCWFENSLTRWKDDKWIHLQVDDDNENIVTDYQLLKYMSSQVVNDYLWQIQELKLPAHFAISNLDLRMSICHVMFWERYGPTMTHLSIRGCRFDDEITFREVLYKHAMNLEYLELDSTTYIINRKYIGNYKSYQPDSNLLAISKNSNLKRLRVKDLKAMPCGRIPLFATYSLERYLKRAFPIIWLEFLKHYPNIVVSKWIALKLCKVFISGTC